MLCTRARIWVRRAPLRGGGAPDAGGFRCLITVRACCSKGGVTHLRISVQRKWRAAEAAKKSLAIDGEKKIPAASCRETDLRLARTQALPEA
jgi:hypothetical protein